MREWCATQCSNHKIHHRYIDVIEKTWIVSELVDGADCRSERRSQRRRARDPRPQPQRQLSRQSTYALYIFAFNVIEAVDRELIPGWLHGAHVGGSGGTHGDRKTSPESFGLREHRR